MRTCITDSPGKDEVGVLEQKKTLIKEKGTGSRAEEQGRGREYYRTVFGLSKGEQSEIGKLEAREARGTDHNGKDRYTNQRISPAEGITATTPFWYPVKKVRAKGIS